MCSSEYTQLMFSEYTQLQVLMFSATLHTPEVQSLADKITQNPVLADLKGRDAVPETVDHVVIEVDPMEVCYLAMDGYFLL